MTSPATAAVLPQHALGDDRLPGLVAPFEPLRAGLPGLGHPWVERFRAEGLAAFRAVGLPTRRLEAWKYTDLQRLGTAVFGPAPRASESAGLRTRSGVAAEMVFINGAFRPDLSRLDTLPPGVRLAGLAGLLANGDEWLAGHLGVLTAGDGHPFAGLNAALVADGAVLHLGEGAAVEPPIRLVFLADGAGTPFALFPRLLVVAEAGSHATLVEEHAGPDGQPYLTAGVAEITVGDGGRLHHYVVQGAGDRALHLSSAVVRIGRDAVYDGFSLAHGAELARSEVSAVLGAPGGEARVNGVYLARGAQHVDNTTRIEHAAPEGRSRQVFKGVLDDRARGVFQGKIAVNRGAQKTDGHQLSRALLLSPRAEMDAKPELEIYADDVKCSHGATAGELDRQALFYLRSRGIGQEDARALLVEAFLAEAVETVEDETVRAEFMETVTGWLAARPPVEERG